MSDIPKILDGYTKWGFEEPFEDHAGPFYMKLNPDTGRHLSAFIPEKRHLNGGSFCMAACLWRLPIMHCSSLPIMNWKT